jgi:hypothetical protein|tara:strand:- start:4281 stop:4520 length:240 start_codon:yes stop_codon:yes gene_type:complete
MKRTAYNWQYGDCLYRIEHWRNAPHDVCPFTVYMLSSNNGKGPGNFVGYFTSKTKAEDAIKKSSIKTLKTKMTSGIILP